MSETTMVAWTQHKPDTPEGSPVVGKEYLVQFYHGGMAVWKKNPNDPDGWSKNGVVAFKELPEPYEKPVPPKPKVCSRCGHTLSTTEEVYGYCVLSSTMGFCAMNTAKQRDAIAAKLAAAEKERDMLAEMVDGTITKCRPMLEHSELCQSLLIPEYDSGCKAIRSLITQRGLRI